MGSGPIGILIYLGLPKRRSVWFFRHCHGIWPDRKNMASIRPHRWPRGSLPHLVYRIPISADWAFELGEDLSLHRSFENAAQRKTLCRQSTTAAILSDIHRSCVHVGSLSVRRLQTPLGTRLLRPHLKLVSLRKPHPVLQSFEPTSADGRKA